MSQATQNRFQLWGWILFIASALFFMISSIRAGDPVSLAGGALFLVACFVFMAPLLARHETAEEVEEVEEVEEASTALPPRKCFRYRPDWFRAASLRSRAPGAPMTPPAPAHLLEQSRRQSVRSELRFFASTR
jgi:hypothetical protein